MDWWEARRCWRFACDFFSFAVRFELWEDVGEASR